MPTATGVLTDLEAFHANALYGERPGFDPRMNQFPFDFTFLDGAAVKKMLDVLSVSQEILSVGSDKPLDVSLKIGGANPLPGVLVFSGTPANQADVFGFDSPTSRGPRPWSASAASPSTARAGR